MGVIPAEVVKRILADLRTTKAILIRGKDSILAGDPQNDIDIFVPKLTWNSSPSFGNNTIMSLRRFGSDQIKVLVKESASDLVVEIDIFHKLTWRGIQMADVESLPAHQVDELGIYCLDKNAEVWLTVLKNVLHGSATPGEKLIGVTGTPSFLSAGKFKMLSHRLNRKLVYYAWQASRKKLPSYRDVFFARLTLIIIRAIEEPGMTANSVVRWFTWRIFQGSLRK